MKSVIFVCLLSLSLCYSTPTVPTEATPTQTTPREKLKAPTPATVVETVTTLHQTENKDNTSTTVATQGQTANPILNEKSSGNDIKADNKTADKDNKTGTKPSQDEPKPNTKPIETTTTVATSPVTPEKKKNEVTTESNEKKEIVTQKSAAEVSTVAPKIVASRAFDGASFVGGIILTLGLLAIGFMGFKYYKNQTERNYHTL